MPVDDVSIQRDGLRIAGWYTLGLIAATLAVVQNMLPNSWEWLRAEWWIWLLTADVFGMSAILAFGGLPTRRARRMLFALCAAIPAGIAWLLAVHRLRWATLVTAELLVRLIVLLAWAGAALGIPYVVLLLMRRRTRLPRWPAKLWFSCALTVVLLETAGALWERRAGDPAPALKLPATLAEPAKDEFRIAAVGGSTMAGYPYEPKFSIPQVVGWQLQRLFPDRKIIVDNFAREGKNFRQTAELLNQLTVRPHLLLVYTGHNEFFHDLEEFQRPNSEPYAALDGFLSASPAFRVLSKSIDERLLEWRLYAPNDRRWFERHIASPDVYARRVKRFQMQLQSLAQFCNDQHIPSVWYIPAGNEAGFDPNRTVIPSHFTSARRARIVELMDRAVELHRAGRWRELESACRDGLAEVPEAADFHFYLGLSLAAQRNHAAAAEHFQAALEFDGHPVRANADFRAAIATVAAEFEIPTINAGDVLRSHTPHGILDDTVFLDHVHPNFSSNYRLGTAGTERILSRDIFTPDTTTAVESVQLASVGEILSDADLRPADLAFAYRREADAFEWLCRWRWTNEFRQRRAAQYARWSERLLRGEIVPGDDGTEAVR